MGPDPLLSTDSRHTLSHPPTACKIASVSCCLPLSCLIPSCRGRLHLFHVSQNLQFALGENPFVVITCKTMEAQRRTQTGSVALTCTVQCSISAEGRAAVPFQLHYSNKIARLSAHYPGDPLPVLFAQRRVK